MYIILSIGILFTLSLLLTTNYKIKNDKLIIRSGFSKIKISINDITQIKDSNMYSMEKNKNSSCYYTSTAYYTMPDRILIHTKDNKSYFIALNNAKNLIKKINKINPKIIY
ncbi:SunI/YnzG family protein [Tepidibacter thalassicus]|uniref:PH domain-containing protein n=1 Tax=Tepidibacter thalassicus DSM 15285 TaxID=1123350 RepID=A0A1M5TVI5_9FIRM|nr:PH domain-containing protein [Tepidibacter thalassicus]SHH54698.1 PH domain-containing protein [Tepidibacter thalassicus DSM 15285]